MVVFFLQFCELNPWMGIFWEDETQQTHSGMDQNNRPDSSEVVSVNCSCSEKRLCD